MNNQEIKTGDRYMGYVYGVLSEIQILKFQGRYAQVRINNSNDITLYSVSEIKNNFFKIAENE